MSAIVDLLDQHIIPAAMPQPRVIVRESDRTTARDELCDEILHGKTRGGFDFAAMLDCELNGDGYTGTVHDLAVIATTLYSPEACAGGVRLAMLDLATKIIEKHLPEQLVENRAWDIAESRAQESVRGF